MVDAPHREPIAEAPLRGPMAEVALFREAHRLFPTIFHVLVTGCTARPKRAGSRGLSRDGSRASSWYWVTCCLVTGMFSWSCGVLNIWVTWVFTGSRVGPVVRSRVVFRVVYDDLVLGKLEYEVVRASPATSAGPQGIA